MNFKKIFIPFRICFAYVKSYKTAAMSFVVAALLSLLFFLAFFAQKNNKIADAANELKQLTSNIRHYYQNRPDYWGLSTQVIIDKKIYPDTMLKDNQLIGVLGNSVLVGSGREAYILMPGARSFDIVYQNLNKQQCVDLASFDFDQTFWLGIAGVTIENNDQNQFFTWDEEKNGLPIGVAVAKDVCKEKNLIIWHCGQ